MKSPIFLPHIFIETLQRTGTKQDQTVTELELKPGSQKGKQWLSNA